MKQLGEFFGALVTRDFEQTDVIKPSRSVIDQFGFFTKPIYQALLTYQYQLDRLITQKNLLLSSIAAERSLTKKAA